MLLRRCRCTQRKAVAFYDWSLLLRAAFSPLSPFRTPLRSLPFTLSPSSSLPPRARLSSSSLSFFGPRELSRRVPPPARRWNRIAFFLLQRRRRRHSKTRTRRCIRDGRKREKEERKGRGKGRTYSNSPSFDRTRAIVCNSVRESNRNSPLSRLPYALLFLMNPSSLSRPSRLQIVIVIADQ